MTLLELMAQTRTEAKGQAPAVIAPVKLTPAEVRALSSISNSSLKEKEVREWGRPITKLKFRVRVGRKSLYGGIGSAVEAVEAVRRLLRSNDERSMEDKVFLEIGPHTTFTVEAIGDRHYEGYGSSAKGMMHSLGVVASVYADGSFHIE